jgi:hypothetical protein
MGEEAKSGAPRWILIGTGIVGLIAAILVAATKYYELHKARNEAIQSNPKNDSASKTAIDEERTTKDSKGNVPNTDLRKADPKTKSKVTSWKEKFPPGTYEGFHYYGGVPNSNPPKAHVELKPDMTYDRILNGTNRLQGKFEFRDDGLMFTGGRGNDGGFVEVWTIDGDKIQMKLWYPANQYPNAPPRETGEMKRVTP